MVKLKSNANKGIIIVSKEPSNKLVTEKFRSQEIDDIVNFPKGLGIKHPFDFEQYERIYTRVGFVYAAIKKYVSAIVGEFQIKTKDPNVTAILESFNKNSNLKQAIYDWIAEGFSKGNGFMEIDLTDQQVKVVNANDMYVVKEDGVLKGYNQYVGDKKKVERQKVIPFKLNQIAHLQINKVADSPYGYGILYPNERLIENIILLEQKLHQIIERKAGSPYHFKVGQPGEALNEGVLNQVKQDLQFLTNKTEWVTDGNVDIKVIEFGELGKSITDVLAHDMLMWSFGTLIPESLMGKGNLAEGLGNINMEDWNRVIAAYQDLIENIIVNKIYKPLLIANKKIMEVEFIWNLPTERDINERIVKLTGLLGVMTLSENLRRFIELEIARLLNLQDADKFLSKPSLDAEKERREEEEIEQPEVPGAKPSSAESLISVTAKAHEPHKLEEGKFDSSISDVKVAEENLTIQEYCNMQEIKGFNYADYLMKVLEVTSKDQFVDLKAFKPEDLKMGLLPDNEIDKLRIILKDGFKKSMTIREIEKRLKEDVAFTDRFNEAGDLMLTADVRPNLVARTETIRLANEGLKNLYKENKIQKVRWLSSVSDRTCEQCMSLNGNVFNINEISSGNGQPPLHPSCRCTLLSVVE